MTFTTENEWLQARDAAVFSEPIRIEDMASFGVEARAVYRDWTSQAGRDLLYADLFAKRNRPRCRCRGKINDAMNAAYKRACDRFRAKHGPRPERKVGEPCVF